MYLLEEVYIWKLFGRKKILFQYCVHDCCTFYTVHGHALIQQDSVFLYHYSVDQFKGCFGLHAASYL